MYALGERNFMKKLILVVALLALMLPGKSWAAEKVFGFADGKYYDVEGSLKYFCFMDHNCFNMDGVLVDMNAILDAVPLPSFTDAVYKPYPDTPTPLVNNPNQPTNQTTMETTQPVSGTEVSKPQDTNLIDCSTSISNCQINVGKDYMTVLIKTVPEAVVTLTFDGAEVQPTQVEQGLATNGQKHTLFGGQNNLTPDTEHTYSLRVETAGGWDVEEGTVTTKSAN